GDAPQPAAEIVARAARARGGPPRRHAPGAGERPGDCHDEPLVARVRGCGAVPGRPVLPFARGAFADSAAPRAPRGHSSACRTLPAQARAEIATRPLSDFRGAVSAANGMRMAWKRA